MSNICFANNAEIKTTKFGQKGAFARRDLIAGEVLGDDISFPPAERASGWAVMPIEEAKRLPSEQRDWFLTFGYSMDCDGGMIGPLAEQYAAHASNYINHSCDPNIWYCEEGDRMEARRDIKEGEELTMDYGTCFINNDCQSHWDCHCGSKNCRGRVRPDDWKKLVEIYGIGRFPLYLREKMLQVLKMV